MGKEARKVPNAVVGFRSSHYAVVEEDKKVAVHVDVQRTPGELTGPITVYYKTLDGTASAGSDYKALSGTLHFGPTEKSKTIELKIYEDKVHEPTEEFYMQ